MAHSCPSREGNREIALLLSRGVAIRWPAGAAGFRGSDVLGTGSRQLMGGTWVYWNGESVCVVEGLAGLWGWFRCKVPAASIKFLDHMSWFIFP